VILREIDISNCVDLDLVFVWIRENQDVVEFSLGFVDFSRNTTFQIDRIINQLNSKWILYFSAINSKEQRLVHQQSILMKMTIENCYQLSPKIRSLSKFSSLFLKLVFQKDLLTMLRNIFLLDFLFNFRTLCKQYFKPLI